MGTSYVTNPLTFLINTLFGLYILLIMIRFLLAAVRADFYNPVSQFIVKVTNPPIIPLRKLVPSVGKIDISTLLLMLALQMLSLFLVFLVQGDVVSFGALLMRSIAELVALALNVFLFSILILVIISWISPGTYNPVASLLHSIAEPVLRPSRRLLPPISGMDFSPIVALIAIQLTKMLVLPPLYHLGQ